jgi:Co/Zn/Cd efflux system component
MTLHLVLDSNLDNKKVSKIKNQLKHQLFHSNIQHVTIETEFADNTCLVKEC